MQTPSELEDDKLANLYTGYEDKLKMEDAFDIDDLVVYPVRLLRDNSDIGEVVRGRYPWMCIDEYQDINCAQYNLIRLLAPEKDSNIFAIGDPDQAIYGFTSPLSSDLRMTIQMGQSMSLKHLTGVQRQSLRPLLRLSGPREEMMYWRDWRKVYQ